MSLFLDANVLLEALLPARQRAAVAHNYIRKEAVVSPLSAHLYVHFGKKDGFSVGVLTNNLTLLSYTSFGGDEIRWAIANRQSNDFEDALQVACAVLGSCDQFVTFDGPLAKRYGQFIKMTVLK